MFRNTNNNRTQISTVNNNNTRILNETSRIYESNIHVINSNLTNNEIIYEIVTGNLTQVKKLVNSSNINKIIDFKNNYTALDHAVRIKKNDLIVEYLINCGANPYLKRIDSVESFDTIDIAIQHNYRYLIDNMLKNKEKELNYIYDKYDDLSEKNKNIEKINKDLNKSNIELKELNEYLTKSNAQYADKIEELKNENINTKRKLDESEKAFSNLLKKTKKSNTE